MIKSSTQSSNQILCQRHNQKAYFLCIQQNCDLPTLICNQCIEDDHAHTSVPIKKLKQIHQQKSQKHQQTDQLTNKIRSFYEDFKQSIIKTIDEDQKLFIKEVWKNNSNQLSQSAQQTLEKVQNNQFKGLKSVHIIEAMKALQRQVAVSPPLQEIITFKLNSRKQFFDNIRNELKGVSINNSWEFVTSLGEKIRKGDKYILSANSNLIGNQLLSKQRHSWKITFHKFDNFSCVGFGIANFNQLDRVDVSRNSVICCICCNGPWSGKSLNLIEENALKNLLSPEKNSITLQIDRINDVFTIYGPDMKPFGKKSLSELNDQNNLVPILKNASNAGLEFTLETL